MFSKPQIEDILQVIETNFLIFQCEQLGSSYLTDDEKEILIRNGIDYTMFPEINGTLSESYKFGILSLAMKEDKLANLSFEEFKKNIKNNNFLPLTTSEKAGLRAVNDFNYSQIKGLGNKIKDGYRTILIENEEKQRIRYENIIKEKTISTLEKRQSVKQLVSELGHATKDWSRDFGRIADYLLHYSFDKGRAEKLLNDYGVTCEVYKTVYPGACKHCIRLYTENGIGTKYKIFKLVDLMQNGSNIGVKVDDYKPVIGPTHPWCRCTLHFKSPNYDWDNELGAFLKPVRITRRKEKVKIKITKS